jgi:hypothetical protein
MPEDKRLIVRTATNRIQEIANNLLKKNKQQNKNENHKRKVLLSSLIDLIVSEKRIQWPVNGSGMGSAP